MSLFWVSEDTENESMKHCNNELIGGKQRLGKMNLRGGMFQGEGLFPLLFVLVIILLSLILREVKIAKGLGKEFGQKNHFFFMDYIKLYTKKEKQFESLVHTFHIFSNVVGKKLGIKICASLKMKWRFEENQRMKSDNESSWKGTVVLVLGNTGSRWNKT